MKNHQKPAEEYLMSNDKKIVRWGENYATGINLIDEQHKELVKLTNELYGACLTSEEEVHDTFKEVMGRMVEYVRFHFTVELELLNRVKYPGYDDHKSQHDSLVRKILEAAKEYKEGNRYAANYFVRTLKEWVFGHIAVSDKLYAAYIREQMSKGLLSDKQLEG